MLSFMDRDQMVLNWQGDRKILPGGRGVKKPNAVDCDGLWPPPVGGSLDIRHRLPGLSVGLTASLRSMPTAAFEVFESPSA